MIKILFICLGNICRSPMAEFVMKDLVEKAGLSGQFEIASAATSTEEIGNPVYPPARRKLAEHGICCAGKTARQMTRRDYETYDYLVAMDRNNLRNMVRFVGSDPEHKVSLLMDYTSRPGDVADPWYTGDFEATWQDVLEGCTALLDAIGGAIHHIGNIHKYARSEDVPEHTLFVITTDGMENASHRYSVRRVKEMIQHQKEKYGWEFLFLGANIDAVETAGHLGIAPDRAVNYHCDSVGTRLNYEVVGQAVAAVRCSAPLDEHWKDAIEEDFRKRQKSGRQ